MFEQVGWMSDEREMNKSLLETKLYTRIETSESAPLHLLAEMFLNSSENESIPNITFIETLEGLFATLITTLSTPE
jgi:hypothetical protein